MVSPSLCMCDDVRRISEAWHSSQGNWGIARHTHTMDATIFIAVKMDFFRTAMVRDKSIGHPATLHVGCKHTKELFQFNSTQRVNWAARQRWRHALLHIHINLLATAAQLRWPFELSRNHAPIRDSSLPLPHASVGAWWTVRVSANAEDQQRFGQGKVHQRQGSMPVKKVMVARTRGGCAKRALKSFQQDDFQVRPHVLQPDLGGAGLHHRHTGPTGPGKLLFN